MWCSTVGFLVTLTLSLLAAPLAAEAQRATKIPRLGVLGRTSADGESLRQVLHALGYLEGQNIVLESRWAEGQLERLPDLAAELVRLQPDLLVAFSHRVAMAAKAATTSAAYWREVQSAARALGVPQVRSLEVRGPEELEGVFAELARVRPDALLLEPNTLNWTYRQQIVAFTAENRLPTMAGETRFTKAGGLMSYGPSILDQDRRAAALVDKILKGAKPADLPVEQPMRFEFVINLKTAQTLGLTLPSHLLYFADEVIE